MFDGVEELEVDDEDMKEEVTVMLMDLYNKHKA